MSRTKNSGIEIYRKALFIFPLVILSGLLMQSIPSENFNISANSADPLVVTFFMDKRNPLNKYLAKFAWGWTSILMWLSSIIVLAGLSGLIGGGGVSRKRRNVADLYEDWRCVYGLYRGRYGKLCGKRVDFDIFRV
ncbi:hypothetical protein BB558_001031 [Smittium angustum]|uniref:Uncharacterized protein n=1 Tax=Smittium angustum TaxID=133377 RepID=A0A2U1JCK8_SMIAN|nr:hypothetical protein BB558_001031 [Smittium angustum]